MFLSLIMLINYTQSACGVCSVDWILAVSHPVSFVYLHSNALHWKQAKRKPVILMPPGSGKLNQGFSFKC